MGHCQSQRARQRDGGIPGTFGLRERECPEPGVLHRHGARSVPAGERLGCSAPRGEAATHRSPPTPNASRDPQGHHTAARRLTALGRPQTSRTPCPGFGLPDTQPARVRPQHQNPGPGTESPHSKPSPAASPNFPAERRQRPFLPASLPPCGAAAPRPPLRGDPRPLPRSRNFSTPPTHPAPRSRRAPAAAARVAVGPRPAPTVRGASEGGSAEAAVTGERAPFLQSGPLKTPLMPR